MKKVISMNLIPEREVNLNRTIPSLASQCDLFYVNLVNFGGRIPEILTQHDNIRITHLIDKGAEYKFMHYNDLDVGDYYFTVDDDIYYPEDYTERHIKYQKKYNNSITTVHGHIPDFNRDEIFHLGRTESYHYKDALNEEKQVLIPGTGTTCIEKGRIDFSLSDFEHKNMDDQWIGSFCYKQDVSVLCIPRKSRWLIPLDMGGVSIWGNNPHEHIDELVTKTFLNEE